MTDTVHSSLPLLNTVQCRLITDVVSWTDRNARVAFWELLPDIMPDLTVHPASLIATVRKEKDKDVLDRLASCPLPAILSPKTVDWRQRLVTTWEKRAETERKRKRGYHYIASLRALTGLDRCGMPPGDTCPSVLPILLDEAHYLQEVIAMTSALSLLRPDPADDLVAWWQKLRSILSILPEPVGPELSVTEIMHLMRELPLENQKADPNAARNQRWQFRPDEMRFRLPMGHTTPTSTLGTVPAARPVTPPARHEQSHT